MGPVLHRDIGRIAPTELDGITINRTKNRLSPFVPIIKTPTFSANSGTPTGFAIEVEDPESQTGFRHLGNVGPNYLLLTNEEVRALALEIALQSGLPFRESRVFWDGARFAHVVDFTETGEAVADGDEVGLSLITRSSYNKSWRYEAALMGKRFLCDNGVLSGEVLRPRLLQAPQGEGGGGELAGARAGGARRDRPRPGEPPPVRRGAPRPEGDGDDGRPAPGGVDRPLLPRPRGHGQGGGPVHS